MARVTGVRRLLLAALVTSFAFVAGAAFAAKFDGTYVLIDPQDGIKRPPASLIVANGEIVFDIPAAGAPAMRAKYEIADKAFIDGMQEMWGSSLRHSRPSECIVAKGFGALCQIKPQPFERQQFEIDLTGGYFFFAWKLLAGLKRQ